MAEEPMKANVDGSSVLIPTDARRLLDWLREDLGITTVKAGCEQGHCGACTVLVDGVPVLACTTLAVTLSGASVATAAEVSRQAVGARLVEAFAQSGAAQCGFCSPGMLCAAAAYVADPRRAESTREALAGNVCRCTGYMQIVEAVEEVKAHGAPDRAPDV
ncbi:(2Fe-2S)-binding protein [Streptomyces sp. NPDC058297]|uniref:(2Fe-2S)-binding protein n=1 Tax=unclassified Streptomyces TaxID=2593676 RepID=UPI0036E363A8